MPLIEKTCIMDADEIDRAIRRLAHQIVERDGDPERMVLIGIWRRGMPLAQRLAKAIGANERRMPPVGLFDIAFYNDDLTLKAPQPIVRRTEVPVPLAGKYVILVDDVLYTGRTTRTALDTVASFGQPEALRLAVLIDRGHRTWPIQPDFVGRTVPTSRQEVIEVRLSEIDSREEVRIMELQA